MHYFAKLFQCDGRVADVEQCDNYVKQTYRNRCIIGGADGTLALTVPTEKSDSPKCLMKDVRISDHGSWRHVHWNALQTAYAGSPFFLYYEDDFRPFFEKKFTYLFDFNLQLTQLCCQLIDIHPVLRPTDSYVPAGGVADDCRELIHPKRPYTDDAAFTAVPYWQVFDGRFGFRPNLSIVDLLFNMGPESILVLQKCYEGNR